MDIIDLHLDLAMNAMEWNRDLRLSVSDIRERERDAGLADKPDRGRGTVSLPALRQGGIGLVVATQIARVIAPGRPFAGWQSPQQAWAQTQAQLAWYRAMEAEGEMVQVTNRGELEAHLALWSDGRENLAKPIGFILSLEGADSLVDLSFLGKAHAYGLRAVGPGHYGPGRYANGTDSTGRMGAEGIALLREMDRLGMVLDVTHLNDDAFWQALDLFQGPVWASHNLCRSLVDHNRQFSDAMIRALVARSAIIGAAMDAWMIVPGWVRRSSTPEGMHCDLAAVARHVDHICQIAGNTDHVCIGSDLDGAYGKEQCPHDLETISDIPLLGERFMEMGYSDADRRALMMGNALRFLRAALPGS
jgi:membrane dipeptidase